VKQSDDPAKRMAVGAYATGLAYLLQHAGQVWQVVCTLHPDQRETLRRELPNWIRAIENAETSEQLEGAVEPIWQLLTTSPPICVLISHQPRPSLPPNEIKQKLLEGLQQLQNELHHYEANQNLARRDTPKQGVLQRIATAIKGLLNIG